MLVLGAVLCKAEDVDSMKSFAVTAIIAVVASLVSILLLLPSDRFPTTIELYRGVLSALVTSGALTGLNGLLAKQRKEQQKLKSE